MTKSVWKVRTLQWQLGTSSKKRKLGKGLWTEEPDDEQPGHQDWETYLDRLFTLLLAYALGGIKALDNAPAAKEEGALGADTTKFVLVPLDVVTAATQEPDESRPACLMPTVSHGSSRETLRRGQTGSAASGSPP